MNNNKLVDKVDSSFLTLAEWSIKWRWLVVVAACVMLAVGLFFSSKVRFDNSYESFFDQSDPAYHAYLDYLNDFQSDEITYILYRVPDNVHGPFDIEVMKTIGTLTQALEDEVPFVNEATSLANVEFIRAEGDSIDVDELLINFPETQEDLLKVRETVLSKPLYVDYLVNKEANYAAIILEMSRDSTDPLEDIIYDPEKGSQDIYNLYPQVSDIKVREILARPEYQGIEFFLTGDAPMNTAYNTILTKDSTYILLSALGLIVLVSMLLFRVTLVGILGPISVVVLSLILTLGFIGIIGWDLGVMFAMVPTLLCAVGVAQSVHILLEFQRNFGITGDRKTAVKASLKKVGGPCLMAAVTTSVGFLVLYLSDLKALSELAIYASAGVMITFILSATLLVVFLARGSNEISERKKNSLTVHPLVHGIVNRCIKINLAKPKIVMFICLGCLVLCGVGVTKLTIDFNFLKEFKPHVEWRKHTELAEEVMGGMLSVAYTVDTKTPNGIKDPALLHALEKVQRFAEQQPLVKKSFSVTDIIKDLNQGFHADDSDYYVLPDDKELVAQYFLVYELSGGEELEEFVSLDFSRTALEFRVEVAYATEIVELINTIDGYIEENPIPGAELRKAGIGFMWIKICEYIADTQMVSYSLVFVMIAIFMSLSFGSIKIGLLSMIPNLSPVVVTLGMMGWIGVPLDYMKLLLATIAIGIAVDDTIHLVTRYRSQFIESGSYEIALERSLTDVGPALTITSIILVISFSSFLFGNTTILGSFGVLLAAAVAVALLADLFLMPVLILFLKPFGEEFTENSTTGINTDTDSEDTKVKSLSGQDSSSLVGETVIVRHIRDHQTVR